jgi:hypothetical protein
MIKAFSFQQAWPYMIFHKGKRLENRKQKTAYRGLFYIHASNNYDTQGESWLIENGIYTKEDPAPSELVKGAIVGEARLVECYGSVMEWEMCEPDEEFLAQQKKWAFGPCLYVLADVVEYATPIPTKGQLGFWDVSDEVELAINTQKREVASCVLTDTVTV